MEWKKSIHVGDLLDVFDTEGNWFLATVLDLRTSKAKNDQQILEALIGYRVYVETGSRTDTAGRHFEGWSETYDEWINVFGARIQK